MIIQNILVIERIKLDGSSLLFKNMLDFINLPSIAKNMRFTKEIFLFDLYDFCDTFAY